MDCGSRAKLYPPSYRKKYQTHCAARFCLPNVDSIKSSSILPRMCWTYPRLVNYSKITRIYSKITQILLKFGIQISKFLDRSDIIRQRLECRAILTCQVRHIRVIRKSIGVPTESKRKITRKLLKYYSNLLKYYSNFELFFKPLR